METKSITVTGARTHNLQNISLQIPREKITGLVGVSGAGKSSLAFDTIYAEGYLRYIESISPYIRQFLDKIEKPPVEKITGLPPAISFKHKSPTKNHRSIIATSMDIYDYLRILYAKIANFFCPGCGKEIKQYSIDQIIPEIMATYTGKLEVCFPYQGDVAFLVNRGYYFYIDKAEESRQRIDHKIKDISIDVLIDSIEIIPTNKSRLFEALDKSIAFGNGNAMVYYRTSETGPRKQRIFSSTLYCDDCNRHYPSPDENLFSINGPKSALGFKIAGKSIGDLLALTITEARDFVASMNPDDYKNKITTDVFTDILARLDFLVATGLTYLQLNRPSHTISRGEFQRINLAFILGSSLSDSLLILDQPSSDLHPQDYKKLASFLYRLKENNNTILLIEHNPEIVKCCDHIIELGPLSGDKGGTVVFTGNREQFFNPLSHITEASQIPPTLTQIYFNCDIDSQEKKAAINRYLSFKNADTHNLKGFDFKIPCAAFTTVTGVSGAGKTTLLYNEILLKHMPRSKSKQNLMGIKDIIFIDLGMDSLRGSTIVAGYFDIFASLRKLFASLKESRILHYNAGHFSFHSPHGRCEQCKGKGYNEIQMQFLPAIDIPCGTCGGAGYKADILKIRFKEKNIRQILDLSISAVIDLALQDFPIAKQMTLQAIAENGLGYIKLGQPLKTLSAGERQRIKLLKHLNTETTNTLFLIDEPTFGLHPYDIEKVKCLIEKLVDLGNTVVAAEHNIQLISHSDYLIELGPGAGDQGGYLVYQGTTVDSSQNNNSLTGTYLKKNLKNT
jgi:excinuclease ABC subunit A